MSNLLKKFHFIAVAYHAHFLFYPIYYITVLVGVYIDVFSKWFQVDDITYFWLFPNTQ
jgi:hypothetical protein